MEGKPKTTFSLKEKSAVANGPKKRLCEKSVWHDPAGRQKKLARRTQRKATGAKGSATSWYVGMSGALKAFETEGLGADDEAWVDRAVTEADQDARDGVRGPAGEP